MRFAITYRPDPGKLLTVTVEGASSLDAVEAFDRAHPGAHLVRIVEAPAYRAPFYSPERRAWFYQIRGEEFGPFARRWRALSEFDYHDAVWDSEPGAPDLAP